MPELTSITNPAVPLCPNSMTAYALAGASPQMPARLRQWLLIAVFVTLVALLQIHHGLQAPLFPFSTSSTPLLSLQSSSPPAIPTIYTSDSSESKAHSSIVQISEQNLAPVTLQTNRIPCEPILNEPDLPPHKDNLPHKSTELDKHVDPFSVPPASVQLMSLKRRAVVAVVSTLLSYLTLFGLFDLLGPRPPPEEDAEEGRWIASSHSWLDRKACTWFGVCGAAHWRSRVRVGGNTDREEQLVLHGNDYFHSAWTEGKSNPDAWSDDERVLREIPQYVFDHAPLVHLYSGERFWPCDIAEHLVHVTPHLNYTPIQAQSETLNLTSLDKLNEWNRGRFVYLQSDDNVEERPDWLAGEKNIPNKPIDPGQQDEEEDDDAWSRWDGKVPGELLDDAARREGWYEAGEDSPYDQGGDRHSPHTEKLSIPTDTVEGEELVDDLHVRAFRGDPQKGRGGRSDAPAVLVVVNKGRGIVDAFWFYFYSFNLGNVVFNVRFGNHVGDWEHSLVRFQHGKPKAVFFSEHNFGEAYSYYAVEKIGKRPVIYSATGTHAMYATAGTHPYVLPWGILHDETDRGPLWDPLLNSHTYTYNYTADTLRSSTVTPHAPTEWFYFAGHWGDKFYPLEDSRQYRFAGQYHYVNGPLGPRFKNLGRKKVCQGRSTDPCVIKNWIGGLETAKRWVGVGEGEGEAPEGTDGAANAENVVAANDL